MKKQWLRHAFAVDPPGEAEPTEPQAAAIDLVLRFIVRRRMTTPALLMLETSRPLNYVASQAMHFFHPIVSIVLSAEGFRHFATFIEQRGSVDYLCRRLEDLEHECIRRDRDPDPTTSEPES